MNDVAKRAKVKKFRAVVYGGGIGVFPPLMKRFQEEFEIVATLSPEMPRIFEWIFRLVSIRWPRNAWYRRWRHYLEKTPFAFRAYTRASAKLLRPLEGQYDLILFLGATFHPGVPVTKPLILITDSCRWLSAHNIHDEVSHFRSADEEVEWLVLEQEVYQSAARIFVGNSFVRDGLITHYGMDPTRVVVSGFGAGFGFGEPYNKKFDGRTILYIGKGDFEKKGGGVLLKAFKKVRHLRPDAVLHIVGQDRLPELPGVVNHGFVRDREKIVSLMRQAHVYTLPSLVDRNPITILEAMAAGTPCVASDYGAMPDLVGEAGLITPCNDVDNLAEALLTILNAPDLARTMGGHGRERYLKLYNWDVVWQIIRSEVITVLAQQ